MNKWLRELDRDRIRVILDKLITTDPPFPALSLPLYPSISSAGHCLILFRLSRNKSVMFSRRWQAALLPAGSLKWNRIRVHPIRKLLTSRAMGCQVGKVFSSQNAQCVCMCYSVYVCMCVLWSVCTCQWVRSKAFSGAGHSVELLT